MPVKSRKKIMSIILKRKGYIGYLPLIEKKLPGGLKFIKYPKQDRDKHSCIKGAGKDYPEC
ncbi:hypothetical protein BROSI_A1363 [Candidatus Brocadia sinica JPN1]|uniref:Uncharacterized protein n=1 Tax=Candidatus Brocadia sinica JPN1 TaxID=1197129 RepID=A0ABQ0JVU6_9BACT|nr:hypothetical protein BROSI_A1363 [Candidatus Brocadia sinica JPN1]GJQ16598.1 MAG: hypothetical protein HBSIN01_05570 [Candidatus Brocadia sinica]